MSSRARTAHNLLLLGTAQSIVLGREPSRPVFCRQPCTDAHSGRPSNGQHSLWAIIKSITLVSASWTIALIGHCSCCKSLLARSSWTHTMSFICLVCAHAAGAMLTDVTKLTFPNVDPQKQPRIPRLIISKDDMQTLKQTAIPGGALHEPQHMCPVRALRACSWPDYASDGASLSGSHQ